MVIDDKAAAINALIDAVEVIERTLGITPYGVYADVRVRLDILEARIGHPYHDPNFSIPFYLDGYSGVSISDGYGAPTEDRVDGSLYLQRDGYDYTGLYVRRLGAWVHIPTVEYPVNTTMVGAYGLLPANIDGYLISMSVVTSDGYLNDAESFPAMVVAASSTIRNLIVTCSDIPTGAETVTITVRKNWQDTSLTATLTSSTPAGTVGYIELDAINSFDVVKGDWITVRCQTSAGCNTVQNIMVTIQT